MMNCLSGPIRWHLPNTAKLIADGNSIAQGGQDGAQSVGGVTGYLSRNYPKFAAQGYANVAIGGQNIDAMISAASDVDGAWDATKANILIVQEITNQVSTGDSAATVVQKLFNYVIARKAAHKYAAVVLVTAPPVYLGDQKTQAETDAWNATTDEANRLLRLRWTEVASGLIETRQPGSPYDQARYPNYLKATFFDNTVINGISNNASWITEPSGGAVPNQKIHYTAAGIAALAPFFADGLLRVQIR